MRSITNPSILILLMNLGIADGFSLAGVIVAGIVEKAGRLGSTPEHRCTALPAIEEPTQQIIAIDRAEGELPVCYGGSIVAEMAISEIPPALVIPYVKDSILTIPWPNYEKLKQGCGA